MCTCSGLHLCYHICHGLQWREEGSTTAEVCPWDKPEAPASMDCVCSPGGGDGENPGGQELHHEGLRGVPQVGGRVARGCQAHGKAWTKIIIYIFPIENIPNYLSRSRKVHLEVRLRYPEYRFMRVWVSGIQLYYFYYYYYYFYLYYYNCCSQETRPRLW